LADRGVDLRTIQEWLGHRSIEMTVAIRGYLSGGSMDFGDNDRSSIVTDVRSTGEIRERLGFQIRAHPAGP
jgi:hypothetical protein